MSRIDQSNIMSSNDQSAEAVTGLVAYGSSQGTTGTVANAIVEGMEAANASAAAVRVDRLMPSRLAAVDILGIGSPVYFLREPGYIDDFISSLPSLEGKKAFVFCTTGMNRVGETLLRLATKVSARGAAVVGAESFPAAMAYLPYRRRNLGNPEGLPDEAVLSSARLFGTRMAGAFGLEPLSPPAPSYATRLKAGLLADPRLRRLWLPGARLNTGKCTGYGSCISRCYFKAIDRDEEDEDDEGIPTITDGCIQCLECITSCPRDAIEVDSRFKESLSSFMFRLGIH